MIGVSSRRYKIFRKNSLELVRKERYSEGF